MKKELDFGVNFHQTFPPTPAYIGRILSVANGEKRSAREVSDLTGIPQGESSGKVVPHLKYAAYMGLIEPDVTVPTLTPLGEVVLEEDMSCSEELTQWLLHSNLSSCTGAPMWHFFVRDLLHNNRDGISTEYLASQMQYKFGNAKYAPVITTYNEFSAFDYIEVEKSSGSIKLIPQRVQREMLYVYGYEMLREWEIVYPETPEITADELGHLACSTCLGLTENHWFEVLEQLATKGVCRINKQLSPFTVVRLTNSESLVSKLYSLLI